jgi:Uma2 family endonuclease
LPASLKQYLHTSYEPEMVVEVLSPTDQVCEFLVKLADYVRASIPYARIVDPTSAQ